MTDQPIRVKWTSDVPDGRYLYEAAPGMWKPCGRERIQLWLRAGAVLHFNPERAR